MEFDMWPCVTSMLLERIQKASLAKCMIPRPISFRSSYSLQWDATLQSRSLEQMTPRPMEAAFVITSTLRDLADAHVAALDWLLAGKPSSSFNLGTGRGFPSARSSGRRKKSPADR